MMLGEINTHTMLHTHLDVDTSLVMEYSVTGYDFGVISKHFGVTPPTTCLCISVRGICWLQHITFLLDFYELKIRSQMEAVLYRSKKVTPLNLA